MNDAIVHYGVKGMKWGVRRTKNHSVTRTSKPSNRRISSLVERGRAYVKDLVDGFVQGAKEGWEEAKRESRGRRYVNNNLSRFREQQIRFNRQQGSYALSGGINPFMFG